jgi:hypothetical protein
MGWSLAASQGGVSYVLPRGPFLLEEFCTAERLLVCADSYSAFAT